MPPESYRPDIDGLRSIAVLSVLFYHVGIKQFSGGFVGVDVFFVISGFLITKLINKQLKAGGFSFSNFYVRRARRLFPALYVTFILSFVFSYVLFSPEHFARFCGALVYSLGSMSNFYFFAESGYFDSGRMVKPLLHTWSLGIEEQFYLFWPITLVLIRKVHKELLLPAIGVLSILSFIYCDYILSSYPGAAFFMMPFRIFEFGIGASVVWFEAYQPKNKATQEILVFIGLVLVIYPVFAYTKNTIFPGTNALIPCIGTGILIYSGKTAYLGRILSNKLAVSIGLISYSLYLVHWPIVVFYKYYRFNTDVAFQSTEILGLVVLSLFIATLMYRFVETPVRHKRNSQTMLSASGFGFVSVLVAFILAIPAATAWAQNGWVWRYSSLSTMVQQELVFPTAARREYAYERVRALQKPFSSVKNRKILIVGDSQAGDFVNILYENHYQENVDIKSIVISAKCQPLLPSENDFSHFIPEKYRKQCERERPLYASSSKLKQADVIVLVAAWRRWGVRNLADTVTQLKQLGARKIYVVGGKAQGKSGQSLISRYKKRDGIEEFSASYKHLPSWEAASYLKSHANGFEFIDLMSTVCPTNNFCRVLTPADKIIFYDGSHVTPSGAKYLGELMKEAGQLAFLFAK